MNISGENPRAKVGFIKIRNKSYPIYEGLNIIGRDPKATVRVSNLTFSKQHAILSVVNSTTHLISDVGSSNGTMVRNIKLHPFKFYNIKDLESITFGDVVGVYRVCTDVNSQSQNEANTSEFVDFTAPTQPLVNIHDFPTQPLITDIHDKETQVVVVEDKKQSDAINLLKPSSQDVIDLSRTELYDDVFADESFRMSLQNNVTKYDIVVDETLPTDSKVDKSITNNENNDDSCMEDDDIILSTQDDELIEKQTLDLIKKSHKTDNKTKYLKIENKASRSSETKPNETSTESKNSDALSRDNKDEDDSETDIEDEDIIIKIQQQKTKLNNTSDNDTKVEKTTKFVEKTNQNDSDSETDAEDDLLAKNMKEEPTKSGSDTEVEDNLLANLPTCENNESSKTSDVINKSNKDVFSDEEEELDLLAPTQNLLDVEYVVPNQLLQSTIDNKQTENNDDEDLLLVPTQLLEIKKEANDDDIDMLAPTQLLGNNKEVNDDDIDMLAPTQLLANNKEVNDDEIDMLAPTQLLGNKREANDDEIDMLAPTQLLGNKKEANDDDTDMLAPTQLLENKKEVNDDDVGMLAPTQLLGNNKITVDNENDDLLAPTLQVEHEASALVKAGNILKRVDDDDDDDLPPTQILQDARCKNNKNTNDDQYLVPTQILETNKPDYTSIFSAPTQILEKNDANMFSPPKKRSILSTKSPRNKEKRNVNFSEELIYDMPTQKLSESTGNNKEIEGNSKEIAGKQNDIFTAPTQPLEGNNDLYKSNKSLQDPNESSSSINQNITQESEENLSLKLVLSETDEESICENIKELPSNKFTDNSKASVDSKITKSIPEPETQLEVEFALETQKIYAEEKTARPDNPLAHMFGEEPTQMTEEITELKEIDNIVSKNNQFKEIEKSRRLLIKIQNLNVATEISNGQIKSTTSVDDDLKSGTKKKKNTKSTSTNENIKPHNTRGKRISYKKLNSGQSESKTLTKRGRLAKNSESDTSEKEEITDAKKRGRLAKNSESDTSEKEEITDAKKSAEISENRVTRDKLKMTKKEAIKEHEKFPSKNSESDENEKEELTEVVKLAETSEKCLNRDKLKISKKESGKDDDKHEKISQKNSESDKSEKEEVPEVIQIAETSEKRLNRDKLKTSKKESVKNDEKRSRKNSESGKPVKEEVSVIKSAEMSEKQVIGDSKTSKKETTKEDEKDGSLSEFDDFINRRTRSKGPQSLAITPRKKAEKEPNDSVDMSTNKTKKETNKKVEKNEKPPKSSKSEKEVTEIKKATETPKKRASRVNNAPKKETVNEDENDENLSDFDDFVNRRTRSKRTHSATAIPKSKAKKEKNVQPEDSDEDTDNMPTHTKKKIVKLQYTDDSEIGASNSSSHSTVVRNTKRSMKIEDYSSDENAKSNTSATSICLNTPNSKRRKYEPLNVTVNQTSNIFGEPIKHKIVFTMLNDAELENSVTKLGGSVIDSVHLCTVLVTSKITRSLKFLVALALGKPIVETKWIYDSVKMNSFQDPWNYLLKDKESEEKFKFVLKDSLQRSIEKKLLSNVVVLLAAKKNHDVLKEIIETSGGKCIKRAPAKNVKAIVVCYEEEKSQYKKYLKQESLTVVSAEAIFSGVLQQELNWNLHLLT